MNIVEVDALMKESCIRRENINNLFFVVIVDLCQFQTQNGDLLGGSVKLVCMSEKL